MTANENNNFWAAVAYVPIFGWIYPYYNKRDDALSWFHARQALYLNITMLGIYFAVWILEHFPIVSWLFGAGMPFYHLTRSVWILTSIAFCVLSAYSAYQALLGNKWLIPYLEKYLTKLIRIIREK